MTVEFCGSTIVVDWECTECGHEWTTNNYEDFVVNVKVPECPECLMKEIYNE